MKFLPDTGASVNIIDRSTYEILMQSNTYPLIDTKTRVFAYGVEEPLKLRGYFNAKGLYNGKARILTIYVLNACNYGNLFQNVAVKNLKLF